MICWWGLHFRTTIPSQPHTPFLKKNVTVFFCWFQNFIWHLSVFLYWFAVHDLSPQYFSDLLHIASSQTSTLCWTFHLNSKHIWGFFFQRILWNVLLNQILITRRISYLSGVTNSEPDPGVGVHVFAIFFIFLSEVQLKTFQCSLSCLSLLCLFTHCCRCSLGPCHPFYLHWSRSVIMCTAASPRPAVTLISEWHSEQDCPSGPGPITSNNSPACQQGQQPQDSTASRQQTYPIGIQCMYLHIIKDPVDLYRGLNVHSPSGHLHLTLSSLGPSLAVFTLQSALIFVFKFVSELDIHLTNFNFFFLQLYFGLYYRIIPLWTWNCPKSWIPTGTFDYFLITKIEIKVFLCFITKD